MEILVVQTDDEIEKCFEVMHFLRPHLLKDKFIEKVHKQFDQGYQMACIGDNDIAFSLIGYRFLETMAWGRILYIDDLITHPDHQRSGYAGMLLDWVFEVAQNKGCDEIHLDSGYQRLDAHRLYLNKGFHMTSHHFSKSINPG